jgi:hypothetical protein
LFRAKQSFKAVFGEIGGRSQKPKEKDLKEKDQKEKGPPKRSPKNL